MREPTPLTVTGDPDADALVSRNPLALLLGMLLDQQVPMEWAFRGPATLAERLGGCLDAAAIVAAGEEALLETFCSKPAVHRFPAAMARRAFAMCAHLVEHYDGDPARLWTTASDGAELLARLRRLPGYGDEKARIFVAVLAKRFGIRPAGWEAAAGPFADDTPRTVADIDSPAAFARVREWKKAQRARGLTKQD